MGDSSLYLTPKREEKWKEDRKKGGESGGKVEVVEWEGGIFSPAILLAFSSLLLFSYYRFFSSFLFPACVSHFLPCGLVLWLS